MITHVMNPDIVTCHINTVETSPITTSDSHVVGFAICASADDEVEHGSIDEDEIMHGEVYRLLDTEETSTVSFPVFVIFITVS
jgi:hypothetical protein